MLKTTGRITKNCISLRAENMNYPTVDLSLLYSVDGGSCFHNQPFCPTKYAGELCIGQTGDHGSEFVFMEASSMALIRLRRSRSIVGVGRLQHMTYGSPEQRCFLWEILASEKVEKGRFLLNSEEFPHAC